jgi:phage terminase large subunit
MSSGNELLDPEVQAEYERRFRFFQENPLEWVKFVFGDAFLRLNRAAGKVVATETGLSRQQEAAAEKWGKLIRAKLRKAEGLPLDEEEQGLVSKIGMSIMSGTGTGKDFFASLLTWHFAYCFTKFKILATANSGKQLHDVYWSELAKLQALARKVDPGNPESVTELQLLFTLQSELMFANLPDKNERGKRAFCRAVTINAKATPEAQGETLAGRHEDHQLFVLDEASGIPDAVWKPVEGTLTGKLNLVLIIFNPTRTTGFALRSQSEEREKFIALRWNSEESELVTPEHIANLAKFGKTSNTYRIRVLGLPPTSDKNCMFPPDWIMAAIGREGIPPAKAPRMLGGDIGGGGDKSVTCLRQGAVVEGWKYNNDKDSANVQDWLKIEYDVQDADVLIIDVIGIGHGVYYNLRRDQTVNVRPGDARRQASDLARFYNKRAEAYWLLRKDFEQGVLCLPADTPQEVIDQLMAIPYYPEDRNRVELKREIRKRLGFSPDEVDALALTYYFLDAAFTRGGSDSNLNSIPWEEIYTR